MCELKIWRLLRGEISVSFPLHTRSILSFRGTNIILRDKRMRHVHNPTEAFLSDPKIMCLSTYLVIFDNIYFTCFGSWYWTQKYKPSILMLLTKVDSL